MNFEVEKAKNGFNTLKLNGIYLYSKYNPQIEVAKFIKSEIKSSTNNYLLIGLGLGYHLKSLSELQQNKKIFVVVLDPIELKLFKLEQQNSDLMNNPNIKIISKEDSLIFNESEDTQVIIPLPLLKALQTDHKLFGLLEDLKTRQTSYELSSHQLEENFQANIINNDPSISGIIKLFNGMDACLVSAGPSLNHTIQALKQMKNRAFIICVGSALKVLLNEKIVPEAIIITDPLENVIDQIKDSQYTGILFYLATANHKMTQIHNGERVIIYQEGYENSEKYASLKGEPLLETGGSVATTAISLLEFLGFKQVFLFGQDLGFENHSHAKGSTSGASVSEEKVFRKVLSNNGQYINTSTNLSVYRRWIESKAKRSSMKMYNTSECGAEIKGVPFLHCNEIYGKLNHELENQFTKIILKKLAN